jgi:uncharacterized Zn finger protein
MSNNDSIETLCGECGETLSNFLHEMAEQNAKVATCPKCGKIHDVGAPKASPPKATKPAAKPRQLKKI